MNEIIHEHFLIDDRNSDDWTTLSIIFDRLGWTHYPENVTGEEIDDGDDSEAARVETVEVPFNDLEIWNYLEDRSVFDV